MSAQTLPLRLSRAVRRAAKAIRYAATAAGLAAIAVVAGVLLWQHRERHAPAEFYAVAASERALPKLWAAPSFAYVDQHGDARTTAMLRGQPWVADFIYTECTSACPLMTSRMLLVQRALPRARVRFVSFSVDPRHDTTQVLADYARTWNPAESRWSLLATDAKSLPDTLAGFRVTAQGTDDPANPIVHSSVFLLVDADGWVRGVYDSNDDGARSRLVADVRRLAGGDAAGLAVDNLAAHRETEGRELYASLGCGGCHASSRTAPPLDGLSGTKVTLEDGTTAIADEDYLRTSIVDPAAQLVAGYPALMPSYAGQISEAELGALVRYLSEMKAAGAGATVAGDPARVATDPVCHMNVRVGPDTVRTTYRGHDVYFCSRTCRDVFLANPSKFTAATE